MYKVPIELKKNLYTNGLILRKTENGNLLYDVTPNIKSVPV